MRRLGFRVLAGATALFLFGAAWGASPSSSSSSPSSSSSRSSSPSSSGGFSAPRSSPSPSSSGGFSSKPAPSMAAPAPSAPRVMSAPSPPSAPVSSGGFSAGAKPSVSVPSVPSAVPKPSTYDTHVNREMSAKAFDARQAPAFKATVGERTFTPQQVQEKRKVYYTTVYRDRYIPSPIGTSYGSFSEQFMWAMMFNAAFAHNHTDDPAYRQWRRDADERAMTDQKVKDQLADLDRKVKDLEDTPKDPRFVPQDVPAEVIFTETALTAGTPDDGHSVVFWLLMTVISIFFLACAVKVLAPKWRFA